MRAIILIQIIILVLLTSCGENKIQKAIELKLEGIDLIHQSQYKKAMEILEESLEFNDQDPETWYYLGKGYFGLKDYDKAFEQYTIAIETDPNFGRAYVNRATIYTMRNDRDSACKDWLKAESLGIKTVKEETKFCK